jgi:hypothetical protein
MGYIVKEVKGSGISLSSLKAGPTVRFDVFFEEDDRRVHAGNEYFEVSLRGRAKNGMRLAASRVAKRYNDYLARTGKRFEFEEDIRKGKDLFESRIKRLVALLEREFAPLAFIVVRGGGDASSVLLDARNRVDSAIEDDRKGNASSYRMIDAYSKDSGRSLGDEIRNRFVFNKGVS